MINDHGLSAFKIIPDWFQKHLAAGAQAASSFLAVLTNSANHLIASATEDDFAANLGETHLDLFRTMSDPSSPVAEAVLRLIPTQAIHAAWSGRRNT